MIKQNQNQPKNKTQPPPLRQGLQANIDRIKNGCVACTKCQAECAFLDKYGSPRVIASAYDPSGIKWLNLGYECSLCGLCAAVCPVGLRPDEMFLEMRRAAVACSAAPLAEHQALLGYERRGTSRRFSYYTLPANCRTIFFPGCALPGTRPEQTIRIYEHLRTRDSALGVVLDCCCCPSHDLGRSDFFTAMFDEMKSFLIRAGVKRVITACPNCHKIFQQYGSPLEVTTVYEILSQWGLPESGTVAGSPVVSVHDPCAVRFDRHIHEVVRRLAAEKGYAIVEMPHTGASTLCCGEGGNAGAVAPDFADAWLGRRREESDGRILLTYCAGCAERLNRKFPTLHILDAVLDPRAVASGTVKVSRSPMTYFNRLRIKRYLQRQDPDGITRERTFSAQPPAKGSGWRRILLLFLLAAMIGAVHVSGGIRLLDPDFLRRWVQSWGLFAPVLFILIYTIAPVLFLPGLPITIAGGILFGPVWGVVYSITGATAGSCAAFLVARYAAGVWVRQRLTSPRWKMLDEGVSRHGWKIVAFTRLIPLFPFNLLNYAFGLTAIPFGHYAVASFVCMLPACIAFIVFSSSLPDLLRGRLTPAFVVGLALIGVLMLLPLLYRYLKSKKTINTESRSAQRRD